MFSLLVFAVFFICNAAQEISTVIITEVPVSLNCSSDNATSYIWKYNGDIIRDANSSTHRIIHSYNTGNYTCEFAGGVTSFSAINFAKPIIDHGKQSISTTEGETNIQLTCVSESSTPLSFYWTMKKESKTNLSELGGSAYTIKNEGTTSVLTIAEVNMNSRADYECFAENAAGNGNTSILLRVQSRLAPLWPFLGILVEIALITFITLIFARKSKNKQSETSANLSDMGDTGTSQRGGTKDK